jgi:Na+/phosphate symporter
MSSANHDHEEEHIHMPSPSWAPIILAAGMAIFLFSVIWKATALGLVGIGIGVLIIIGGLAKWIIEDIKNASH